MTTIPQVLATLAQRVIQQRDTYGWSVECDEAINAMRHALAAPYPVAPVLPADDRLTVAAIAMASGTKMLPLMQAIEAAGEGNVTANQKLTVDQALQAIAALSKQVPAGEIVGTEKRGFALVTVIRWEPGFNRIAIGTKLYALSQSGQADSTGGKA